MGLSLRDEDSKSRVMLLNPTTMCCAISGGGGGGGWFSWIGVPCSFAFLAS